MRRLQDDTSIFNLSKGEITEIEKSSEDRLRGENKYWKYTHFKQNYIWKLFLDLKTSLKNGRNNSVQFSSIAQSCPTLCNPMNHSTPGLPVHYQLPELAKTHVHQVNDAIQPSHRLSSSSAFSLSQHQGLFQGVSFLHQVAKLLEFQLLYQSFQLILRTIPLGLTGWISLQFKGLLRVFSSTTVQKHQFFGAQLSFGPTLTSIHDHWKNHSFD